MQFEGVYVALVSPFHQDGSLDILSFESHLNHLATTGIAGFVPCGTTGEASTLSNQERDALIEATVKTARKKGLRVIAGCASNSTQLALALAARAQELGCDAALVVTPYYNRPTQTGLEQHYTTIAKNSKIPVLLYNVPSRTGVTLSINTVQSLLANPNILGLKEASGNHGYWMDLSQALDWRERSWLAGDDDAFATTMALGGCGIISATANIVPEMFVGIHKACITGDFPAAFAMQRKLLPLVRAAFVETSPSPIKTMLAIQGKTTATLRLPLVPPSEQSNAIILSAMKGLLL